jgi:hypothetical protein
MGMIIALVLLTSVASVLSQTYIQIPLKYVTAKIQRPEGKQVDYWNATICTSDQKTYDGKSVTANFNLPLNLDWNPFLGVVYATVSNNTDFSPSLCTNQEGSTLKNMCTFTYSVDMGPNIYIKVEAGNEGHIQYSAGIAFSTNETVPQTVTVLSRQQVAEAQELMARPHKTDVDFMALLPIVRLDSPGTVKTSGIVYYTFTICESDATGPDFTIEIVIIGTDPGDAFSTYACKAEPCAPDNGNVVASSILDSSINVFSVSYSTISPGGVIYLAILGFGGAETNDFSLGAVVKSPTLSSTRK